jgi:hypothetical protein
MTEHDTLDRIDRNFRIIKRLWLFGIIPMWVIIIALWIYRALR